MPAFMASYSIKKARDYLAFVHTTLHYQLNDILPTEPCSIRYFAGLFILNKPDHLPAALIEILRQSNLCR